VYLKYKNQEIVGDFIGNWFGSVLSEQKIHEKIDVVVPVPLHRKKLKKRGIKQGRKVGD